MRQPFHPITAIAICLALADAAYAGTPAVPTEPWAAGSLAAWKRGVIDRFDQAVYLDADDKEITEKQFFEALGKRRQPFDMRQTDVDGHKTRIVLKLSTHQGKPASPEK